MKNVNIRIFPNEDYSIQCEAITDKAKELLQEKKDEAYSKNPNITPEELEKIRIRPFGSNSKFALREDLFAGQDYTWNFWVGQDDEGKLILTLQIKKAFVKEGGFKPKSPTIADKMTQDNFL